MGPVFEHELQKWFNDKLHFGSPAPRSSGSGPQRASVPAQYGYVDIYCGGGGMAYGAYCAGATMVCNIDRDPRFKSIHDKHFGDGVFKTMSVPQESVNSNSPIILHVQSRLRETLQPGEPWHLHISPPCNLISAANRSNNDKTTKESNEYKFDLLVRSTLEIIRLLNPTSYSIENSPLSLKSFQKHVKTPPPTPEDNVIDLHGFGSPSSRKRFLMVRCRGIADETAIHSMLPSLYGYYCKAGLGVNVKDAPGTCMVCAKSIAANGNGSVQCRVCKRVIHTACINEEWTPAQVEQFESESKNEDYLCTLCGEPANYVTSPGISAGCALSNIPHTDWKSGGVSIFATDTSPPVMRDARLSFTTLRTGLGVKYVSNGQMASLDIGETLALNGFPKDYLPNPTITLARQCTGLCVPPPTGRAVMCAVIAQKCYKDVDLTLSLEPDKIKHPILPYDACSAAICCNEAVAAHPYFTSMRVCENHLREANHLLDTYQAAMSAAVKGGTGPDVCMLCSGNLLGEHWGRFVRIDDDDTDGDRYSARLFGKHSISCANYNAGKLVECAHCRQNMCRLCVCRNFRRGVAVIHTDIEYSCPRCSPVYNRGARYL